MVTALNVLSAELLNSGGDCTWIEKRIVLDRKIPLRASWRQASLELEASRKKNRRYSFLHLFLFLLLFFTFRIPPLHRCPGTSCSSPVEHRQCTARRRQDTLWPPTRCTRRLHGPSPATLSPDPPSAWRSPTSTATGSAPLSVPSSSPWPCSFSWPTSLVSHLRCRCPAASWPPGMGWLNTACCSAPLLCFIFIKVLNPHFAPPKYAVMAVTVAEVADVSPAHVFPGIPPSFTHWAGPLLFFSGVMTNIC